ncbi:MAG: tRNA (adenosine(37)-N6)-threonylcarbamoyltransferase complex transferase subunit TsaD [Acidimicrobiales bacterium]
MTSHIVLGIESSCDDSAAAVLVDGELRSSVMSSQIDIHARYGGVVPEIAARQHERSLLPAIEEALILSGVDYADLSCIAVTRGPGLVGSLVVGVSVARALALVARCPVVGVNHLEAHVLSSFLEHRELEPPTLCLLVSGGHTMLVLVRGIGDYTVLGETRDDAVGEVYDKVGRYLGLGYPGGPAVDQLSLTGDPTRLSLPRPMRNEGYEMSFSGLKTATIRAVRKAPDVEVEDVCASFVAAVLDVLISKLRTAVREHEVGSICIGGGVAASGPLRDAVERLAAEEGLGCFLPPRSMCTDNAAMIAYAGNAHLQRGTHVLDFEVLPGLRFPGAA